MSNKTIWGALAACLAIVGGAALLADTAETNRDAQPTVPLGLVTSLPIYWGQDDDFAANLTNDTPAHWVRKALEQAGYALVPLDVLAGEGAAEPAESLAKLSTVVIAQPRPFAPADFAALDSWVRGGGHALIFADPVLTEHSDLPLGDPRRPQYEALLSPIFTRWGVEQVFDESQAERALRIDYGELVIPADQSGTFRLIEGEDTQCRIEANGLVAQCGIGKGMALIIGDAALLDQAGGDGPAVEALLGLLEQVQGA